MSDQIPPADELHAVGEQIKELEARKAVLRQLMISDPSARTGNDYVAEVREITKQQPDITAMRELYPEVVAEFTFPRKEMQVKCKLIDHETGEIKSLRRKPKLHTMRVV